MESWSDKFLKTPSTAPGRNVKAVTLGKYLDDLKIQGLQMAKRKQEQKKQVAIDDALKPRPRGFTPRQCSNCAANRPAGKNYVRVYCTRGNVRFCKCHWCNFTWTQYFDICTMGVVQSIDNTVTQQTTSSSLLHGDISIVTSTSRSSD